MMSKNATKPSVFGASIFILLNSNANCPNRPSQNEFRKRVSVRLHLISARQVAHAEFGMWSTDLGMGSTAALGCRVRRPRRTPFSPMFPARALETAREARALPQSSIPKRIQEKISAKICGALPRRRYVRIHHFNAGSRRATSSALVRLLNALMRK